jgi:hypothetical protein
MQQGVTMATSQIVAKTNQQISSTIRKTFENKRKTEDEIFRRDTNARRKPGSDMIVGTQTYDPPGLGYERLRKH